MSSISIWDTGQVPGEEPEPKQVGWLEVGWVGGQPVNAITEPRPVQVAFCLSEADTPMCFTNVCRPQGELGAVMGPERM